MCIRIASSFITVNIFLNLAEGIITTIPDDRDVLVGQLTYFNCSSTINNTNVDWYFYPVGGTANDRKYVYESGRLVSPYADKFQIEQCSSGVCNLVINNITLEDAGRYECQEDQGMGDKKSAELVVLEDNPNCSSSVSTNDLMGPNNCGIEPDELRLSCSVSYRGKSPPVMQWKSSKEDKTVVESVTSENDVKSVNYHLTIKPDLSINGASYLCQIMKSTTAQQAKPNCTSETIHLLYAFNNSLKVNASVGDKMVCVANTSQNCNYKWKWFKGEDSTTESNNATLIPTKAGWHRCEAMCAIKKHSCTMTVMTVYVPATIAVAKSSDVGKALMIVIPIVIVLLAAAVIIPTVYGRKLKGQGNKHQEEAVDSSRHSSVSPEFSENETPGFQNVVSSASLLKTMKTCVSVECTPNLVIRASSVLNGELFIITEGRSEIEVYNSTSFEPERSFQVEEINNPVDIKSCLKNNCLYVLHYVDRSGSVGSPDNTIKIHKINNQGETVKSWSIESSCGRLSVGPDGNVIVTLENQINEYAENGDFIREIRVKDIYTQHALKLTENQFLISLGDPDDGICHKVITVNVEGNETEVDPKSDDVKIIASYGGYRGKNGGKLDMPWYLAMDVNGDIYVAERDNRRITVLSPKLEYKRVCWQRTDGLYFPLNMFMDVATDRLFLTDFKWGAQIIDGVRHYTGKVDGRLLVLQLLMIKENDCEMQLEAERPLLIR